MAVSGSDAQAFLEQHVEVVNVPARGPCARIGTNTPGSPKGHSPSCTRSKPVTLDDVVQEYQRALSDGEA